jgi:hypothetical protein
MTNHEILEKLTSAFPKPDYGVEKQDYGRQFRIIRIKDGLEIKEWFNHVRNTLDTTIENYRDYFASK